MKKIPTLFVRDPTDLNRLLRDVHPDCQWVIDGEGVALHKADGTCMLLDQDRRWWARRQVKPGRDAPPNYVEIEHDETTGKRFGWEPIEQSTYAKLWRQAIDSGNYHPSDLPPGTYELIGEKINNNPEGVTGHVLRKHDRLPFRFEAPRDYDGLRDWLVGYPGEGVVWHHPDGRMAKIKRRDIMTG
ncbi:MAG TPA: DUF5565 family protein [Amycolatopsis sp.]|nr:DUF5565 family protein [Amycolatopsis sp.]